MITGWAASGLKTQQNADTPKFKIFTVTVLYTLSLTFTYLHTPMHVHARTRTHTCTHTQILIHRCSSPSSREFQTQESSVQGPVIGAHRHGKLEEAVGGAPAVQEWPSYRVPVQSGQSLSPQDRKVRGRKGNG